MGTVERRYEILKILCRRRYETITNLAGKFSVSERTMRRDIEALSLSYPIYTQSGRYGGGVYVLPTFSIERMYMNDRELNVLKKLSLAAEKFGPFLSGEDKNILHNVIREYTRPQYQADKDKNKMQTKEKE